MEPHEELQGLTELAMFGGPFFFSLLFGIVFIKMSHSYLITAMKRTDPPAEKFEKKLYERYFYASMIATFILSAVSVTWWIYSQNQLQTFQAVIQGVKISQTIVANENDIYLRTVQRDAGPGGKIRDYHFAIVSSNPFTKGQQFSFNWKSVV